jgi:hypothetical protein
MTDIDLIVYILLGIYSVSGAVWIWFKCTGQM